MVTRTVSFGKVEETAISPQSASHNSTVTFSNDEMNCWMHKKEIKMSNDFYKMPFFKTNESGQILNDINKTFASPLASPRLDSIASVSAVTSHSTSEQNSNRTFTDALQKASLIEDIITRRNKPPAVTNSSNLVGETKAPNESWAKRQKNDAAEHISPPINSETSSSATSSFTNIELAEVEPKTGDFDADEFQFFMSAIEKLKATSLFQADDLKKMTDEQIYATLVEHARKQRSSKGGLPQKAHKNGTQLAWVMPKSNSKFLMYLHWHWNYSILI